MGFFFSNGSRVLLHLSCLKTLGAMFVEPIFAMILGDFAVRLCLLRNERMVANRILPFNTLIGAISVLRLITALPQLLTLFGNTIEESTIFIRVEGMTHYQLLSES